MSQAEEHKGDVEAPGPRASARSSSWLPKLVLLAMSGVIALVLLEVVARVAQLEGDFFFQLDPQVGATYIPNKEGWFSFPDGRNWVEINSAGYRDVEWQLAKPPGTRRIVMLGDSYLASLEVGLDERVSQRVDRYLDAECKSSANPTLAGDTEVLNFGVTGFGTAQELETLRHRALDYDPDLVLLFYYTGNDLYNNSFELDAEPNRLHYVLNDSGELERLPYSVSDSGIKRWLRHHSKGYLFVRNSIMRFRALHRVLMRLGLMQQQAEPEDETSEPAPTSRREREDATARLEEAQHQADRPAMIERAWAVTRALILEVDSVAESSGADFGLVIVPTKEQIEDLARQRAGDERAGFRQGIRRGLAELCESEGLDCRDLTEGILPAIDRLEELFFPVGGHWTPAGQEVASSVLGPWLRDLWCPMSQTRIELEPATSADSRVDADADHAEARSNV